jgi:hypothetical protein
MTLATVDSAFVGEASPWRIDMRSILFQRCYANDAGNFSAFEDSIDLLQLVDRYQTTLYKLNHKLLFIQ